MFGSHFVPPSTPANLALFVGFSLEARPWRHSLVFRLRSFNCCNLDWNIVLVTDGDDNRLRSCSIILSVFSSARSSSRSVSISGGTRLKWAAYV